MRFNLGTSLPIIDVSFWLDRLRRVTTATPNGGAYSGFVTLPASVGNFSHIQLFNPVGSLVTVLLRAWVVWSTVTVSFQLRIDNTARVTDEGTRPNLLSGGSASRAHMRSEQNAALQGTEIFRVGLPANTPWNPPLEYWIQLAQDQGVTVVPTSVNTECDVSFQWLELN